MGNNNYTVAELCRAAEVGDADHISQILNQKSDLVNVCMAENNEHRVLMEAGADPGSGIYPHRDATSPLVLAEERGYDDIVTIIRDVDEKQKLAACKSITISEENEKLFETIDAGRDDDAGSNHRISK